MQDFDFDNKRILEVGCGLGLASLVHNHLGADITATDYHPEADKFLALNTQLNGDKKIPFLRTGWADQPSGLGLFDVIIGSDLLYEAQQVELLAAFINQHAKPRVLVVLIDPGRGLHAKFSKKMQSLGYQQTHIQGVLPHELAQNFKGKIIHYQRE